MVYSMWICKNGFLCIIGYWVVVSTLYFSLFSEWSRKGMAIHFKMLDTGFKNELVGLRAEWRVGAN